VLEMWLKQQLRMLSHVLSLLQFEEYGKAREILIKQVEKIKTELTELENVKIIENKGFPDDWGEHDD